MCPEVKSDISSWGEGKRGKRGVGVSVTFRFQRNPGMTRNEELRVGTYLADSY